MKRGRRGLAGLLMLLAMSWSQAAGAEPAPATQPRPMYRVERTIRVDLKRLAGIALDATPTTLYAVGDGGVRVLDLEGRERRRWSTAEPATCVALDAEGHVYVGFKTSVVRYDADGRPVSGRAHWGQAGTGEGQLRYVRGLAVAGDNVFVADAGNRCVHRFDVTGDFILDIGRRDVAAQVPGIVAPSPYLDCAVGPDGFLYVTNPGRWKVERYDFNGHLLGSWGRNAYGPEGFSLCCNPTNLAVDRAGRVVTAEKGTVRVKLHDRQGRLLAVVADTSVLSAEGAGFDLAVDAAGRIYVADPVANRVLVLTAVGQEGR